MSYSTAADIQADFKNLAFSSSTLVTTAAVTQFIAEADSLINAYVGERWVTPITSGEALTLMQLFSRTLVSARVRSILRNNQSSNTDANQSVKGDSITVRDVMASLASIKNGDMQLIGASLILANSSFYSQNQTTDIEPVFRKGVKQW